MPRLAAADLPVETKPPEIYRRHLADSLTPLETILRLPVDAAAAGDSGLILLDERLAAIDERGRRTIAWHFAYKTLTDAGIKTNSEDVYRFDKHEQKAYLVLAETIQPDGTRQAVQPNAVLLQSPQRQAQYSLYDDQSELKIIFPNVRVGSITHGIVVIQDLATKIPDAFCQNFSWGSTWATERLRFEINLPKTLETRLKIESLGAGVPPSTTPPSAAGRIRHAWALEHLRGEHYEPGRAPSSQVGPALVLSTVADWSAIGQWFRGLLKGRDELRPELAREVDKWCQGLTAESDVIATLHARVADDVRYVGLEFGAADYQPHDCNEVWSLRYGDCKDKANLLVAMLRRRGIDAGIALVNTDHLGLVNRRAPEYQSFDHAIVAIPRAGGDYLFCDPTISYSVPGMISTRAGDRDVFVITRSKAEWTRTPAASAGSLRYAFDLRLSGTGELAGWLTLTAEGYYGANERRRYAGLMPQEVRSTLSETIRGFYPAAEVIDASVDAGERGKPYSVKAYFTVTGAARSDERRTLAFPRDARLLPRLGDSAERRTTYFLDRDVIVVDATFALPDGLQAQMPPAAFDADAGSARYRAAWSTRPGSSHAELELQMKSAAVRREDFSRLYQAQQALQAWLEHPLVLEPGANAGAVRKEGVEIDFPLMPSGEGQIALADSRYPYNGNPETRQLALERTIQYFPKDANTVFRASARLAILAWNGNRLDEAHDRLAKLLAAYAGQVTIENYAWGQNVDGLVLRDLHRDAEALALLQAVARDTRAPNSRRAAAAADAAALLAKDDRGAAIELLQDIVALPDGATTEVESRLAQLSLEAGRREELVAHLKKLVQARPDSAEEELTAMLRSSQSWPTSSATEPPAAQFATMIAALVPQPGEALGKALAEFRELSVFVQVRATFGEAAKHAPLAEWTASASAPQSLEDYDKAVSDADAKRNGAAGFRAALQSLVRFGADADFPRRLWRAANYADWTERQGLVAMPPAMADTLLELCDQLPAGSEYYLEGKLLRAGRLERAHDYAAEIALMQATLNVPNLPENYFLVITRRLATANEQIGNYPEACRLYSTLEALTSSYRGAAEAVLRGILLHLHLGEDAQALHGIEILERAPAEVTKNMAGRAQALEFQALVKSGQAAATWAQGRSWWPRWRQLAAPFLSGGEPATAAVPLLDNLVATGQELGAARRDKDARSFFATLDSLVSAARWLPSDGVEVASTFALVAEMAPGSAVDFRQLILSILEGPHPVGIANAAAARVQLAANYFDDGLPARTLTVAREFVEKTPADGAPLVPVMIRLWGMAAAATKTDMPEAAAAIEKSLTAAPTTPQRAMDVAILADVYRQLGRREEERELLKRELANPAVNGDRANAQKLQARLETIEGETRLGVEVAKWRVAVGVPWYDYAEPASLDDPRLRDINAILEQPDKQFNAAEKIKLWLLVAEGDQLPVAQRQAALRSAALTLLLFAPSWSRFDHIAASVVDNAAFDTETRVSTLWLTLVYAAGGNRSEVYRRWRQHALVGSFNETIKKNVAMLDEWIAHDPFSSASLLQLAEAQSAQDVSSFRGYLLNDLFAALLNLGDFAAAEKFIALVAVWRPGADFPTTVEARQLDFSRQLRLARLTNKVHERLAAMVTERYPALADQLPDVYSDLRFSDQLPFANPAQTLEASLYLIKTRRFSRKDFDFWGVVARNLPRDADNDAFGVKLLAAAVEAAETDELKQAVLRAFSYNIDLDEPSVREGFERVAASIDRERFPEASFSARIVLFNMAERLGRPEEVDSFFYGYRQPMIPFIKQTNSLSRHLRARDLTSLAHDIDTMNSQLLLDPTFANDVITALTLLGRPDELAAVRKAARDDIRKSISLSWLTHDRMEISKVSHRVEAVPDPELVPANWAQDLRETLTDPLARLQGILAVAISREDWKEIARSTTDLNQSYPTHYHYYWWRGLAEAKLGNAEAARHALEIYTRYAKEEAQFSLAQQLLLQLSTGTR